MKRNKKRGIVAKIFVIFTTLLLFSSLLVYLIIYQFLPTFYYDYKKSQANELVTTFVKTMNGRHESEWKSQISEFYDYYRIPVMISDSNFNPIILHRMFIPFINEINNKKPMERDNYDLIEKEVNVAGQSMTLSAIISVQSVSEVRNAFGMFLPYIGIITIILSFLGAYISSKLIAAPLIKLNRQAKRLSELDFDGVCEVHTHDEIEELSDTLNLLSDNLKSSMNELKVANAKLNDDIEREREKERKRREFTAIMSHELKTPITVMKGQVEGMIEQIGSYKNRDVYLPKTLAVLEKMESLVKGILKVLKLETPGFIYEMQMLNLNAIIAECLDFLEPLIQKKHLNIVFENQDILNVKADPSTIRNVCMNILQNAMTYIEDNKNVYISLINEGDSHVLYVENEGSNIPDDQVEKLFDPFYRLEKSRNRHTGGSGIGLYLVKLILEAHQCEYGISNTQRGVQFTIRFIATDDSGYNSY